MTPSRKYLATAMIKLLRTYSSHSREFLCGMNFARACGRPNFHRSQVSLFELRTKKLLFDNTCLISNSNNDFRFHPESREKWRRPIESMLCIKIHHTSSVPLRLFDKIQIDYLLYCSTINDNRNECREFATTCISVSFLSN